MLSFHFITFLIGAFILLAFVAVLVGSGVISIEITHIDDELPQKPESPDEPQQDNEK